MLLTGLLMQWLDVIDRNRYNSHVTVDRIIVNLFIDSRELLFNRLAGFLIQNRLLLIWANK